MFVLEITLCRNDFMIFYNSPETIKTLKYVFKSILNDVPLNFTIVPHTAYYPTYCLMQCM